MISPLHREETTKTPAMISSPVSRQEVRIQEVPQMREECNSDAFPPSVSMLGGLEQ